MKARINPNAGTQELTLSSQGLNGADSEPASCSEGAVLGRDRLKLIGHEVTIPLLRSNAVEAPTREGGGKPDSRQAAARGPSPPLSGAVVLSRPLSQSRAGGATRCPLARPCQGRVGTARPLRTEGVSVALASAPAGEGAQDFAQRHGGARSAPSWPHLAHQVGQSAGDQQAAWPRAAAAAPAPVALRATGVEGTTLPVVGAADKEARCGPLALDEQAGERVHPESLGTRPEAGKATFAQRFPTRGARVKARSPHARPVC